MRQDALPREDVDKIGTEFTSAGVYIYLPAPKMHKACRTKHFHQGYFPYLTIVCLHLYTWTRSVLC